MRLNPKKKTLYNISQCAMKLEKKKLQREIFPQRARVEKSVVYFILFGQKSKASRALYLIGGTIASPIESKQYS